MVVLGLTGSVALILKYAFPLAGLALLPEVCDLGEAEVPMVRFHVCVIGPEKIGGKLSAQ